MGTMIWYKYWFLWLGPKVGSHSLVPWLGNKEGPEVGAEVLVPRFAPNCKYQALPQGWIKKLGPETDAKSNGWVSRLCPKVG